MIQGLLLLTQVNIKSIKYFQSIRIYVMYFHLIHLFFLFSDLDPSFLPLVLLNLHLTLFSS